MLLIDEPPSTFGQGHAGTLGGIAATGSFRNGSFRKLGVPYFGVLIIRILLFRAYGYVFQPDTRLFFRARGFLKGSS